MSGPIVYVDLSEVREGKLDELKTAMKELVAFVEANEPEIPTYAVFFDEDGTHMSVLHAHRDRASLELHMDVAGPEFPKVADFINLVSIDVYGDPGDDLIARFRAKAEMLGSGTVRVHPLHSGFERF